MVVCQYRSTVMHKCQLKPCAPKKYAHALVHNNDNQNLLRDAKFDADGDQKHNLHTCSQPEVLILAT